MSEDNEQGMREKIRQDPLENTLHSLLFYHIAAGFNYAQKLAGMTNKTPPIIVRQLKELAQKGVIVAGKEKDHNKTVYVPNWKGVLRKIVETRNEMLEEKTETADYFFKKENKIKYLGVLPKKVDLESYQDNAEVLLFVKNFFYSYMVTLARDNQYAKIMPLRTIFEELITCIGQKTFKGKSELKSFFSMMKIPSSGSAELAFIQALEAFRTSKDLGWISVS